METEDKELQMSEDERPITPGFGLSSDEQDREAVFMGSDNEGSQMYEYEIPRTPRIYDSTDESESESVYVDLENDLLYISDYERPITPGLGLFFRDQGTIRERIRFYLEKSGRKKEFIKQFEEGYCSGIASLWLCAKWLQTQPNPKNKQRDDIIWFDKTIATIVNCYDVDNLTKLEREDIDRFVNHIEYFQNIESYRRIIQGELHEVFLEESEEERELKKEYSIAALFTLDQLQQLLNTDGVIQEGSLILISSHDHDIALFKEGNELCCFNTNFPDGEITQYIGEDVAKFIFQSNKFDPKLPSPVGFRMFTFGKEGDYPPQSEVLKKIGIVSDIPVDNNYGDGESGLMLAVSANSVESVRFLLGCNSAPNIKDNRGWSPLIVAVSEGLIEVVRELVKAENLDFNIEDNRGNSALILAVERGDLDMVMLLLENSGVDVDKKNWLGKTPLIIALEGGETDIAMALLARNDIDVNMGNINGMTPFMVAANVGNLEVFKELLREDVDYVDSSYPLSAAGGAVYVEDTSLIQAQSVPTSAPRKRKRSESDVSSSPAYGQSFLKSARNVQREPHKRRVIDINLQVDGDTALTLAVGHGYEEIVKVLLENKMVDFDVEDSTGWTPLMIAVQKKQINIARMLLEAGADYEKKDIFGQTAIDMVAADDIRQLLLEFKEENEAARDLVRM